MNSLFCKPSVLGFVGVPDDHFVDVGLCKFLRLDAVLLASSEQEVVKEGDVQFEHFNKLDHAAVGYMLNSPSKLNARGSLSLP